MRPSSSRLKRGLMLPEKLPDQKASSGDQFCKTEQSGLTMMQAEDLLDWLENHNSTSHAVTWRQDNKVDLNQAPHRR